MVLTEFMGGTFVPASVRPGPTAQSSELVVIRDDRSWLYEMR
jgi:hypothetical protein